MCVCVQVKSYAQELDSLDAPMDVLPLTAQILDPVRCSVVCQSPCALLEVRNMQNRDFDSQFLFLVFLRFACVTMMLCLFPRLS